MLMSVKTHVAGPVAPRKEPPLPTEMETGWESVGQDYEEKRKPFGPTGYQIPVA
jgi:hypothetical protein